MKLWQKIYIFSLALFILAINITGFILVQSLHNSLLGKEIDKSITENKLLAREFRMDDIYYENYFVKGEAVKIEHSLGSIVKDYMEASTCEGKIQILDMDNQILYTDFEFPEAREKPELKALTANQTNYILRNIGDRVYVYICSSSKTRQMPIKVYYAKDITAIYEERDKNYAFFFKLDLAICCIFSIFMLLISRSITRPVEALIYSANRISAGHYGERAQVRSKDEFNVLSQQFNQMAQTVEEKIGALEKANEEKETFINNFTHELKTPLTSIIGYADFMRTSRYDEKLFFDAANYIYKEGKNLEQIAFKMMDLIYAKSQTLHVEHIDMRELFSEIEMSFKARLKDKELQLVVEDNDTQITADRILLKMLLYNLMDNAIKTSKQQGHIYLGSAASVGEASLWVRDEGIGISQEHMDKICQPFYIVDTARTKKNNGAGIGLAICQKIMEVHHAQMEIASEVGRGTKITIIFKH